MIFNHLIYKKIQLIAYNHMQIDLDQFINIR